LPICKHNDKEQIRDRRVITYSLALLNNASRVSDRVFINFYKHLEEIGIAFRGNHSKPRRGRLNWRGVRLIELRHSTCYRDDCCKWCMSRFIIGTVIIYICWLKRIYITTFSFYYHWKLYCAPHNAMIVTHDLTWWKPITKQMFFAGSQTICKVN